MDSFDDRVEWIRISDENFPTRPGYEKTLWGPDKVASDVSPVDLNQGYIGDCWVIASLSALAEKPSRIERIIENDYYSESGIYALNMYMLGVPFSMIIDDRMPMKKVGDHYKTYFENVAPDGSVWGAIIEKAFAKYYGNYQNLMGGWMANSVSVLNGSPSIGGFIPIFQTDDLWQLFNEHQAAGNIISAASANCGNDSHTTESGIACNHAYSVLGMINLPDEHSTRLLKMRNPWGSVRYHGDWSYHSELWTDDLREFVEETDSKADQNNHDGIFYIDIDSFKENFAEFSINYDTYSWKQDYFLKLNDFTQDTWRGGILCEGCIEHKLQV